VALLRELNIPTERRRLVAKLVPTFADRGCHVVSVTNLYGRILGFLDRSRYFFVQAAPQLYSRGCVDPVTDPLLLRKSGSAVNRTRTSGCVARISDHKTTGIGSILRLRSDSTHSTSHFALCTDSVTEPTNFQSGTHSLNITSTTFEEYVQAGVTQYSV
jgi:hypothetical protein